MLNLFKDVAKMYSITTQATE